MVSTRRREKLTIESIVSLPFPSSLQEGWEEDSLNFSDVLEDKVEAYAAVSKGHEARKEFIELVTHTQCKISPNQYKCEILFVRQISL